MQMEWIQAFLAVADRGGFTAASVQLYRSQGRVSSYIAALERELGARLFDRDQRPVRLTAAGEAFVDHARAMVEDLETGREAMAAVQQLTRGDVTLAAYPSAGAAFVPEVLRRFSDDFPDIRVELVEQAVHGIDVALDEGPALVAVRPTLPPPRSTHPFGRSLLWREPMCLVIPEAHPLAGQDVATLADLRGEPLVVSGSNLRYDTDALRLLMHQGAEPQIRLLSDQPQLLVGLVRNGLAIGFTNQLALESVRTDGVSVTQLSPPLHQQVAVYWSAALAGSPAATALLDTVRRTPPPAGTTDLREPGG
ncbi:MAG: LysR family transcriptional regulator [Pseudonocardiaceae bacterium]|nr:LysR family transcriptional regulator [Pseudonocardiaceae bacterium]